MLLIDSSAHADDASALGLLIQRLEVAISAIFIFCLGGLVENEETASGERLLMGFSLLMSQSAFL